VSTLLWILSSENEIDGSARPVLSYGKPLIDEGSVKFLASHWTVAWTVSVSVEANMHNDISCRTIVGHRCRDNRGRKRALSIDLLAPFKLIDILKSEIFQVSIWLSGLSLCTSSLNSPCHFYLSRDLSSLESGSSLEMFAVTI